MLDDEVIEVYMYMHGKRKKVGEIWGDRYITDRYPNMFFIKHRGFGISVKILNMLAEKGVKDVVIYYHGKKGLRRYTCPLWKFLFSSKEYDYEIAPGIYDKQKFVSIDEMKEEILMEGNKNANADKQKCGDMVR